MCIPSTTLPCHVRFAVDKESHELSYEYIGFPLLVSLYQTSTLITRI